MISTNQNLVHKNVQMKLVVPTGMLIPKQHVFVSESFQYKLTKLTSSN